MDSDNYEVLYCPEDDEYRVYCAMCDKLCIERYYKNHKLTQIIFIERFQIIPFN